MLACDVELRQFFFILFVQAFALSRFAIFCLAAAAHLNVVINDLLVLQQDTFVT